MNLISGVVAVEEPLTASPTRRYERVDHWLRPVRSSVVCTLPSASSAILEPIAFHELPLLYWKATRRPGTFGVIVPVTFAVLVPPSRTMESEPESATVVTVAGALVNASLPPSALAKTRSWRDGAVVLAVNE